MPVDSGGLGRIQGFGSTPGDIIMSVGRQVRSKKMKKTKPSRRGVKSKGQK